MPPRETLLLSGALDKSAAFRINEDGLILTAALAPSK